MTVAVRRELLTVAVALLAAMAAGSALMLIVGASPARVYGLMMAHAWGDAYGLGQTLYRATPLVFTGLAVALASRAGLFNVGAEGQLVVGSFATAVVGAALPGGVPGPLAIVACVAAGAAAGAALGALPGWLKARFGAHEVLGTIMLNFVAGALVLWAGKRAFFVAETVHTRPIAAAARMPSLGLGESPASLALVLALACAVGVHLFVERTRRGYELRALGRSPTAAEAGGVAVGGTVVLAMALSGALAGLVGSATVLGYKGYFEEGLGAGAGFMGIAVALLGRGRPLGVVAAALLFGTLSQGGLAAGVLFGVPREIVDVLEAVIILVIAVAAAELRRRPA